jgi:putative mycofactocin binding protein MftB
MTALLARPALLDQQWELSPMVALRPEPFGALVYHFGTRRLTFLKRPELSDVLGLLGSSRDAREALRGAGVAEREWEVYAEVLATLADTGMIRPTPSSEVSDDRR